MKRRDFIKSGILGSAALGTAGCSGSRRIRLTGKLQKEFTFEVTRSKPRGGTMPMGEIGRTGIEVSKFAFGSHMTQEIVPYEKEREVMIREAYDLGVNLFDVYDNGNWRVYQYEPMGRYLRPMIDDVVISIVNHPYNGRNCAQEFERTLRVFGRDYIDMVRHPAYSPESRRWGEWETLLAFKEKGYIRALGIAFHYPNDIDYLVENFPLDYVIFPYNFYHNLLFNGKLAGDFTPVVRKLRDKGIGIVTMKPFGTDWFIKPLIQAAQKLDTTGEISLPQAALRYIMQSGLNPDATLGGMYNLDHVYENIEAYFTPVMQAEEKELLEKLRQKTIIGGVARLPAHYRFLDRWAPPLPGDEGMEHA